MSFLITFSKNKQQSYLFLSKNRIKCLIIDSKLTSGTSWHVVNVQCSNNKLKLYSKLIALDLCQYLIGTLPLSLSLVPKQPNSLTHTWFEPWTSPLKTLGKCQLGYNTLSQISLLKPSKNWPHQVLYLKRYSPPPPILGTKLTHQHVPNPPPPHPSEPPMKLPHQKHRILLLKPFKNWPHLTEMDPCRKPIKEEWNFNFKNIKATKFVDKW